jgi:hypothetical protein
MQLCRRCHLFAQQFFSPSNHDLNARFPSLLTDFSTETVNNSLQRRLDRFELFDSMDSPALNRHLHTRG